MSYLHQKKSPADSSRFQPTTDSPVTESKPASLLKSEKDGEVPSPTEHDVGFEKTPSYSRSSPTKNLNAHVVPSVVSPTGAHVADSQSASDNASPRPVRELSDRVRNAAGFQQGTVQPVSLMIQDQSSTPPQLDLHPAETEQNSQARAATTNVENNLNIAQASGTSQLDETKPQPIESLPQTSPTSEPGSPNYLLNTDVAVGETLPQQQISTAQISSLRDAVSHLGAHGCVNLTQQLDEGSFDKHPAEHGGFGDIYRGNLKDGVEVAIKTIRLQMNPNEEEQKALKHAARELYTWSKCQHPNVQRLLGLVEFRNEIGMVSAWESNGSLSNYLRQHPAIDRCQLSVQVAKGLSYLHDVGIVHGDLKASNILVSESGAPLLIDFGNSTLKEYSLRFTTTTSSSSVSMRWAAPEMLAGTDTRSIPADIYALGMTILASMSVSGQEIITGNIPWLGKIEAFVMVSVAVKQMHPERPISHIPYACKYGDALWDMLKKCWSLEPASRPSANEVKDIMQGITPEGLVATPGQTFIAPNIGPRTGQVRSRSATPEETQEPNPKRVRHD